MSRKCRIVCASACRVCDITPCDDRVADQQTEEKANADAARSAGMTVTELFRLLDGSTVACAPNPFDDRTEDVKEAQAQQKCGMRSDLMCRHCAEEDCSVRKAPRTY